MWGEGEGSKDILIIKRAALSVINDKSALLNGISFLELLLHFIFFNDAYDKPFLNAPLSFFPFISYIGKIGGLES